MKHYIVVPLGYLMKFCYQCFDSYALAIILFIFLTKVILLPTAIWSHTNTLRLVKLQPEMNFIKAKYYGDKDTISNEQLKMYKRVHYHPVIGILPMLLQFFLLGCVISIVYNPLTYVLSLDGSVIKELIAQAQLMGYDTSSNKIQLIIVGLVQEGVNFGNIDISAIKDFNTNLFGFNLCLIPSEVKGKYICVPILAGLSALMLSLFQNKINPLQAEQNKFEQALTSSISVIISLVLGGFVPAGIGFYWIVANIFAILQQLLMNAMISPKKHIDYERLEESRKELAQIENSGTNVLDPALRKRERADYKRFFSVENKHFVIYAESSGFYKYFQKTVEYILDNSNIIIHYITNDPDDNIFKMAEENSRIKAYFIGPKKLVTLFMKMDADIVLMTTPDLENFQYKRSYVKKDIEYIYTGHGVTSTHLTTRKGANDHYDTIFVANLQQIDEIRKREELYNLPAKNLVPVGYGFMELLQEQYDALPATEEHKPRILIAPSWQKDNILDSCVEPMIDSLLGNGYEIIVRPHPEYIKRYKSRLDSLMNRYKDISPAELRFEENFNSAESIYTSDLLITDWSSVAYEFCFVTLRPCLFVDTPVKITNPDYKEIGIEPLDFTLRDLTGIRMKPDEASCLDTYVKKLIAEKKYYRDTIKEQRDKIVYRYGEYGKLTGDYIIKQLIKKQTKSHK